MRKQLNQLLHVHVATRKKKTTFYVQIITDPYICVIYVQQKVTCVTGVINQKKKNKY